MPWVVAVSGFHNSGKTTLCRFLAEELRNRGLTVGYLKRTHENVCSSAGTDTGNLLADGCDTALWGADGVRVESKVSEFDLRTLAGVFFPGKDVLLLEGGKNLSAPKIWVGPAGENPEGVTGVIARYDRSAAGNGETLFGAGDERALADFLENLWKKAWTGPVELYSGEKRVPVKAFVGEFIEGALRGMMSALKGVTGIGGDVRVYLRRGQKRPER
ncbi:MAG: molybdopterin-guanine dinucleotide biosynthesis protein MobB [Synergistota bacterium]|nr:molybdopterin-guanine dinucleotide biosynthesis protein MobB [Synergistota bacterium]